jgi:hypothetical protein
MKFFPKLEFGRVVSFRQVNHPENKIKRALRPVVIPWFSVMFPASASLSEAHVHHLHLLRSCTWENTLPLVISPEDKEYWQLTREGPESFSREAIAEIAKRTAIKMAETITYPTAASVIEDPLKQRVATKRLFEAIRPVLNGDPYLGTLYLLAAGENPTSAPAFGMGFIDRKGFFPDLFDFLHSQRRLGRLLSIMEKCPFGKPKKDGKHLLTFFTAKQEETFKKCFTCLGLRSAPRIFFCPMRKNSFFALQNHTAD